MNALPFQGNIDFLSPLVSRLYHPFAFLISRSEGLKRFFLVNATCSRAG
jgi:hypothetical protein